ncbi:MAG: hypothetical protein WCG83_02290 [Candidatus Peregrinibacteria bacterium]
MLPGTYSFSFEEYDAFTKDCDPTKIQQGFDSIDNPDLPKIPFKSVRLCRSGFLVLEFQSRWATKELRIIDTKNRRYFKLELQSAGKRCTHNDGCEVLTDVECDVQSGCTHFRLVTLSTASGQLITQASIDSNATLVVTDDDLIRTGSEGEKGMVYLHLGNQGYVVRDGKIIESSGERKTYTNDKYRFGFNYPSTLAIRNTFASSSAASQMIPQASTKPNSLSSRAAAELLTWGDPSYAFRYPDTYQARDLSENPDDPQYIQGQTVYSEGDDLPPNVVQIRDVLQPTPGQKFTKEQVQAEAKKWCASTEESLLHSYKITREEPVRNAELEGYKLYLQSAMDGCGPVYVARETWESGNVTIIGYHGKQAPKPSHLRLMETIFENYFAD